MSTAKKKIIPIEVRDEYILGSGVSIGARGSYDSVVLRTKFDDSWIGLNKYATWTNALGVNGDQKIITALDLVDGEVDTYDIPVPAFATAEAGTIKVSFTGYVIGAGEDTVDSLANTVSGAFRVLDSNATKLDGGNTSATVAEQLVAAMTALSNEWNVLDGEMDDLEDKMDNFTDKELERQSNEIEREKAETGRNDAETEREANEQAREEKESDRQTAEIARNTAETERENAETARATAEEIRISNEAERKANEEARKAADSDINKALDAIISIQNTLMGGGSV